MKKTCFFIVVFLAIFYSAWLVFAKPVLSASTICFANESNFFDSIYQQTTEITDKIAQKKFICSSIEESNFRLLSCLKQTKQMNFLGDWVLNDIPYKRANARHRVSQAIYEQNQTCFDNQSNFDRL
ncbi:MAG: hypothetical protein A3J60_00330 [Candidatus Pacebacteria bacterium RIFCSPHIGHO2_02_FULL_46_9]|nr:MAG: hypothetical protein A3J60_00330 [Candidatus Pacebacteria bacterium RIFCSPHIGHO2_02_FULL_46_9]